MVSIRPMVEEFEARQAAVVEARAAVDVARHAHQLAAQRLAYATRTRKPDAALQPLRDELHAARITLQRARRALLRAL